MGERILVVDDEHEIADLIEVYLANENYKVYKFYDGQAALDFALMNEVDLAILDIMLPHINGYDVCKKVRAKFTYPIIMLTAKDDEVDKIMGLTLGADDYLTKPFRPLELVARVKAQLRRYKKYNRKTTENESSEDGLIIHAGLVMNINTHECILNEESLSLTPTEFEILKILCQRKGYVISPEVLCKIIWGEDYYSKSNNTIPVHIRHIREKMHDSAENPKYIKTVWGCGYKIEE